MKKIVTGRDDLVGQFVCDLTGGTWISGRGPTIGLEQDGKLVAGVLYEDYNGANINAHIAAEGKTWLNRSYLWFMFAYPFNQLGCKRITAAIPEYNKDSIRFVSKLGFIHEATLKDADPEGDVNIMVMWRENCRWLEIKHE